MIAPDEKHVWDKSSALARVRGRSDRLIKLAQKFIDELPVDIAQLEGAIKEQNYIDVRNCAHTIKGVAANMSAEVLRSIAMSIEAVAIEEHSAALEEALAQLKLAFRDVDIELHKYIATGG